MRVHYIYCHPLTESYHHVMLQAALATLRGAGHEVDLLDLYAEKFDPVLSADGRRNYHDTNLNQAGLETYVARLRAAEALVVQFPTWCFGFPAMLKGYFDRLYVPGVAFDISDPANVRPMLTSVRRIVGITTYGRPWWTARYVGDPPRKMVTRYLPRLTGGQTKVSFHALYHMNVASEVKRRAFIDHVKEHLGRI